MGLLAFLSLKKKRKHHLHVYVTWLPEGTSHPGSWNTGSFEQPHVLGSERWFFRRAVNALNCSALSF